MAVSRSNQHLSALPTYSSVSSSRLQSLYSDLARQKVSNPASFESNVDWWRRTLEALTLRGAQPGTADALVLHASKDLPDHLRFEGVGKPLGLAAVIVSYTSVGEIRGAGSAVACTRSWTSFVNRRTLPPPIAPSCSFKSTER